MANRFPLILNTSSNQIQELSASDTLDLTGSGLNLTGITTFSTGAQLNLGGGTNINTGTRGDILYYDSNGRIQKLSLGTSGKFLKSNGTDLVYGTSGTTTNVFYVAKNGTDGSGFGTSIDTPFLTIKYAVANIGTPSATAPAVIFVKSGVYEEGQLPIVVPAHTTIAGDSLRATIIKPASGLDSGGSIQNNRSVLFRMSNATVLQDLVMDGMGGYTPGSPNYKPENATIGGTYLALNAASVISTKSPYIYNCTSFGNGATGAVLDGSLHSSGNRSMLFHTYTAVHSDGLGIWLKNNANAELISTFTYYCTIGLAATGGSKIRSLNSSNAYGEYGVYSAGFDTSESANQGTIKGQMLVYTNVLTTSFQDGEQVTGGTSNATAYVVNVQAEPKRIYIVSRSGTFQSNETVTGGISGATATLTSGTATVNQSGRILVTTFASAPDAGDSLQFASTDGNAFQIQSVSSVTANSVAYKILVFSTSRATAVAENVNVLVRKEFSLARLTGHDFLQVGTGGTDTTNWPNNPTQSPAQADQVVTNETDPGRVYYTATDDLGNFYVGDQFKVDQATGNVTLDASAFNLSGLESLRLGSVGGLIGAAVGEFSTDVTLSQNSDTKVSTQKAVKTYVDTLDGVTPVGGTFTVAGISTVTGTTQFTKQLNVSGVSTFHGNVNLLDGDRLRVGSSEDLQVYHDGNHSYIAENGGGDLKIQASAGSIIIQRDNGHEMIKADVGGPVELYFNDAKKIETTNTGAVVTGILTATDFSGASGGAADFPNGLTGTTASFSGNVSVGGVLTYEDVTNVDSVGIVTARNGLRVTGGTSNFTGDATFNGGAGAVTIPAGSDIRIAGGGWTGEYTGGIKIQPDASNSYLQYHGTMYFRNAAGANKFHFDQSGNTTVAGSVTATGGLYGGGANITNLNGSNIASGTVPVARIGTGTKSTSTFYRGDGTFATVTPPAITAINNATNNRILTSEGGTTVNCESDLTYNGTSLGLAAGKDIRLTNGNWTGEHAGKIQYHSNKLYLQGGSNGHQLRDNSGGTTFEIGTTGICAGVNLTMNQDVTFNGGAGAATIAGASDIRLTSGNWTGNITTVKIQAHDNALYLCGGSNGIRFRYNTGDRWYIKSDGHFEPATNNTYDIGTTGNRVRNIYTNDLNLSNEGSTNSIDNTWGDYTIQEGESDLFLINNRSGKKYKFNLTEVN